MSQSQEERWVSVSQASQELNIPYRKINRIIKESGLSTRGDILDKRVVLVDVNQLKRVIGR